MTTAAQDVFTSILDAPLDDYSVPDVGDMGENDDPRRMTYYQLAKTVPVPVVPFVRTVSVGSYGKDVVGAKRAIWRANGLPLTTFTRTFGPIAASQLKVFQRNHGLGVDGQLGRSTLAKLGSYFDQYAFLLYAGYPPGGNPSIRKRNAIVAYAVWGYNNRAALHYVQFRPYGHILDLEHLPESEDCSVFAIKSYRFGGATDPSGFGFDGYGNTGTMRQHGRMIPVGQIQPGDLVHYDAPQHVAAYVGNGRVIGFGSEIGPLLLPMGYRRVAQIRSYF